MFGLTRHTYYALLGLYWLLKTKSFWTPRGRLFSSEHRLGEASVYFVSGFRLDVVEENFEDAEAKEGNSIVF
jgi:hypothetical protein